MVETLVVKYIPDCGVLLHRVHGKTHALPPPRKDIEYTIDIKGALKTYQSGQQLVAADVRGYACFSLLEQTPDHPMACSFSSCRTGANIVQPDLLGFVMTNSKQALRFRTGEKCMDNSDVDSILRHAVGHCTT